MALKMRPTGFSSGFYKDTVDYSVFCGGCIGASQGRGAELHPFLNSGP